MTELLVPDDVMSALAAKDYVGAWLAAEGGAGDQASLCAYVFDAALGDPDVNAAAELLSLADSTEGLDTSRVLGAYTSRVVVEQGLRAMLDQIANQSSGPIRQGLLVQVAPALAALSRPELLEAIAPIVSTPGALDSLAVALAEYDPIAAKSLLIYSLDHDNAPAPTSVLRQVVRWLVRKDLLEEAVEWTRNLSVSAVPDLPCGFLIERLIERNRLAEADEILDLSRRSGRSLAPYHVRPLVKAYRAAGNQSRAEELGREYADVIGNPADTVVGPSGKRPWHGEPTLVGTVSRGESGLTLTTETGEDYAVPTKEIGAAGPTPGSTVEFVPLLPPTGSSPGLGSVRRAEIGGRWSRLVEVAQGGRGIGLEMTVLHVTGHRHTLTGDYPTGVVVLEHVIEPSAPVRVVIGSHDRATNHVTYLSPGDNPAESWYEVGDEIDVRVEAVRPYGHIVSDDTIRGLLHISELSWAEEGAEELNVGDVVTVRILSLGTELIRATFSRKALLPTPFQAWAGRHAVDDWVEGVVVGHQIYGVFVEVDGLSGLLHASQIPRGPRSALEEQLPLNERIRVRIADIDTSRERFALSLQASGS